ncbi:hypothetical protein EDC04DRAFT_2609989 [Pisolithus marmoratus]|nr:hypothetical protein EDC04DRAFT_2609989 [Pisolithus marmoratus]
MTCRVAFNYILAMVEPLVHLHPQMSRKHPAAPWGQDPQIQMKWNGICTACPQPSINVSPTADLDHWKYTRTLVMDGNFKAEHMHKRCPDDQKSACNNHKAISQASVSQGKLNSTGIFKKEKGISMWHVHGHRKECYARYSLLFIKGSGWVDGEIIETLWSTLNIVSASTHSMMAPHCQELLDFQMNDSNFMKTIQMSGYLNVDSLLQKLKAVRASVVLAQESFDRLDVAVMPAQQMIWKKQEEAAMNEHICDPSVMDTFEIQLKRGTAG